ncbi:probable ubiquitin-like-specific protease 2A isoform X2 [Daucus carota subsp. sativus]|uniref:probable ubiquitin-like-specific protease 2A isoform X2 n=1 Tax=Daucus carota subsp. sativus TaxID=79200 RepID=UPI003083CB4A
MGKTLSRRAQSSSDKFAGFNFDDDPDQHLVEKHSLEIVNKFNSIPAPPKPSVTDTPRFLCAIDKYDFLKAFSKGNKDQDKKSGHEPIQIDASEEVVKGCASSLEVNVVSRSPDSYSYVPHNNHSAGCCLSKLNYASRGPDSVGTSTSSNRRVAKYAFPLDSQLVGITSDDDDSIELNSESGLNCHNRDEALSAERVLVYGFDDGDRVTDRAIMFLPVHIVIGNKFFLDPQLTFTKNHVKLEVEGSSSFSGPLSFEWTFADIVSIESAWDEELLEVTLHLHLRSKDAELAMYFEDSGIVKLNWEFPYPHWPELQNKIWALDNKLKDLWTTNSHVDAGDIEDFLVDKFSSHHFHDLGEFVEVTFPKGEVDAVSIGWNDIQLLQPRTFINDTIIDFYMKYLKNQVKHKEVPQFHFFNCFFFRKLVDLDGDFSREHEGREVFLRVRKWTRKLNLFEKDYIFIPVNFSSHWSLIVICHPAEVANLKDEEMQKLANREVKEVKEFCKVPCILHMDSIKGSHRGLEKLFQGYLLEEWKDRHSDLLVDISSRFGNVPFIDLKVPQQENLFDCGLFLLHYAELFIGEVPENFNPFRIGSSTFLSEHWFSPAEASSKRAHIKELIYRISDKRSLDVCSSDNKSPSESAEVVVSNNSRQFLNEFCASANSCMVNHSNYIAHQKFGTKPVVETPHILHCDGEPKLSNDEILESRYNTRSSTDGYTHPARQYNQSKSIMSPIEEHEESEEQETAMSNWDKELNATESKLLPGISVDFQEVEKQDNILVSGDQISAVLDLDVEEFDKMSAVPSTPTPSDEFADCVVEDSEEICETQDDDDVCQRSANHQNKASSFNQVANSVATSLPSESMLNDGLANCVVGASEEKKFMTPWLKAKFGCAYQQEVTAVLSSEESNFIEITDSGERHTSLTSDAEERMSAKRPRNMLLEEEEPLRKRFQTIVID